MPYLYETHCHCSRCSRCAHSSPTELVRAYRAAGYAGLVLTDHFIFGNTAVAPTLPWPERMGRYHEAYLEAKVLGDTLDFDVLFGLEHNYGGGKEVLLYGIGLPFLLENPDIPDIPVDEFLGRVRAAGGLIVHAHPFRDRGYINSAVPPRIDLVDGIEIYNAFNRPEENRQALVLARSGNFLLTSGGDIHDCAEPEIGKAGLWLPRRVKTGTEFAQALRTGDYAFQVEGKRLPQVRETDLL